MQLRFRDFLLMATLTTSVAGAWAGSGPDELFTTRTLTFGVDANTTITRTVQTTTPTEYLAAQLPGLPPDNAAIIRMILDFPRDGSHGYWWPKKGEGKYDGATADVYLDGQKVMSGEPKHRSFCCGLTLQVFTSYLNSNDAKTTGITPDQFKDFQRLWFCTDLFAPGPADALTSYNLGQKLPRLEDALPGDFVQLWRKNKSGHSVIFINWIYGTKGERVGIQYWSTQPATDGIGFRSELFGDIPGTAITLEKSTSVARIKLSR